MKVLHVRAAEILKFPPYGLQPGNWLGKGLVHGLGGVRPIKLGGGGGIVIGGGEVRLGNGAQIVVSGVEGDMRFVDIIQGSGLGVLMIENEKSGVIEVHTCQQQPAGEAGIQTVSVRNDRATSHGTSQNPCLLRAIQGISRWHGDERCGSDSVRVGF